MDLGRFGLLSRDSAVGSGSSGFEEENPPFDPPESVLRGEDLLPTVTDIGSARFSGQPGRFERVGRFSASGGQP